jgi:hypothetical protein
MDLGREEGPIRIEGEMRGSPIGYRGHVARVGGSCPPKVAPLLGPLQKGSDSPKKGSYRAGPLPRAAGPGPAPHCAAWQAPPRLARLGLSFLFLFLLLLKKIKF